MKRKDLIPFGVYPTISLLEARETAEQARKQLVKGIDPSEVKQKDKKAKKESIKNTFKFIAMEWYEFQRPNWTIGHANKLLRSLEKDVLPYIGDYPISKINIRQIKTTIERVTARGAFDTANSILQRIGAIFNYAILTERAETNPAYPLRGVIKQPKSIHMPALPQSEITGQMKNLGNRQKNVKIIRMETINFLSSFLPDGILEHFDIVDFKELTKDDNSKDGFYLYLEEKNQLPVGYDHVLYESKGFVPAVTIQDFPIRGKALYLVVKRRRWRLKTDHTITLKSDYSFIAKDCRLTQEVADFLKGTGRDPKRYDK